MGLVYYLHLVDFLLYIYIDVKIYMPGFCGIWNILMKTKDEINLGLCWLCPQSDPSGSKQERYTINTNESNDIRPSFFGIVNTSLFFRPKCFRFCSNQKQTDYITSENCPKNMKVTRVQVEIQSWVFGKKTSNHCKRATQNHAKSLLGQWLNFNLFGITYI